MTTVSSGLTQPPTVTAVAVVTAVGGVVSIVTIVGGVISTITIIGGVVCIIVITIFIIVDVTERVTAAIRVWSVQSYEPFRPILLACLTGAALGIRGWVFINPARLAQVLQVILALLTVTTSAVEVFKNTTDVSA